MRARGGKLALRLSCRRATFGVPGLRNAADIPAIARAALQRSEELADAAYSVEPGSGTLSAIDGLSSTLCGVLDALECARNVHPDEDFTEAADTAYQELAERMTELNTDERLHAAVAAVAGSERSAASLSPEHLRFARAMVAEFEHDGASLSARDRGKLRALHAEEARLSQRFSVGARARGGSDLGSGVWIRASALAQLPDAAQAALRVPSLSDGLAGGAACGAATLLRVRADAGALAMALRHASCEHARRELHECREGLGADNLHTLEELLRVRHAIAATHGAPSYAAHTLRHDRMEACPTHVAGALRTLSARVAPQAAAELWDLREAKRRLVREGAPATPANSATGNADGVHEWDLPYLMEQGRVRAHASASEISQYMTLEGVLSAVQLVLHEAFGLSLYPAVAVADELWHPSVRKMLLGTVDGAPLGVLYLDLQPRARKTPQPALYTLRAGGGAALTTGVPWLGGGGGGGDGSGGGGGGGALKGAPLGAIAEGASLHLHLPAAVLACDLPVARGAGCDGRSGGALLTARMVETLFHEVGHAVHALVSRTQTHHFAGLRTTHDFVETPALLMERFATEPRVLLRWARHHATGRPLPAELARAVADASRMYGALDLQTQCLHSLVDLELHGTRGARMDADSSANLVRTLTAAHTVLPLGCAEQPAADAPPPRWHATFGHLAGYGAGYYTYLWARSLSRRVWRSAFEEEPLNRQAGERWCSLVLRHGGSREPRELLRTLLGADGSARRPSASGVDGAAASKEDDAATEAVDAALMELVDVGEPHRRDRTSR